MYSIFSAASPPNHIETDENTMIPENSGAKSLNIVFSENAYDMLFEFFGKNIDNEGVAIVSEGRHLGPISDDGYNERKSWLQEHLGVDLNEQFELSLARSNTAFEMSLEDGIDIYAWVDSRSAAEYADFLYWIERCRPKRIFVVEPSLLPQPGNSNFSENETPSLIAVKNNAKSAQKNEIMSYILLWEKLKAENAAFRLFDKNGTFRSFSINAFDDTLLNATTNEWEAISGVVLRVMNKCWPPGASIPGDLFFYARLIWLSKNSNLDVRGDLNHLGKIEIRTNPILMTPR